MSRRFDLDKQQRWLGWVRGWQRSQLSIRDYCARHHLSEPSFYSWKRVLAERGLLAPSDTTTQTNTANTNATTNASPATSLFVVATLGETREIGAVPQTLAPQPLEVVLPDGLAVRVAAGFDAVTLQRLLALLREATVQEQSCQERPCQERPC